MAFQNAVAPLTHIELDTMQFSGGYGTLIKVGQELSELHLVTLILVS